MITTPKPHVVVTNRIFVETQALLEDHVRLSVNDAVEPWAASEIVQRCRDADGIMAFMTDRIDAALIGACPRLKVIGAALKGYDNIDVGAAERAGVWVTIVPDLLTVPTAELAIALMLGLGRNVRLGDLNIRKGGFHGWRPSLYGRGLEGAIVGVVGFGRVGQAIAERLAGFKAKVLAWDKRQDAIPTALARVVQPALLDDLLRSSDYVVLALPLLPETLHIIDRERILLMKHDALLINPARGSLVDEQAVAAAIEAGRLGGYASDVFECEDWARPDRPLSIDVRLLSERAPTLLTPHIGSAVVDVRRDIELSAARSIIEALAGEVPMGAINSPERPRALLV